ncbi:HlyD family efflux transporter periplasmic adaptor subunit [Nereida sp. MMG025]|uniref:HlyD family efflux transporter periplasmic adaptor subunit n=1 Tax=Nereida sp. MMG025 TaxID=2909981 RepID=UPI001F183079|nr:HlyD family efflux transporter periplasmic adaptor subunit [Nereida sp. MMG025]MCF6444595.1 HlyD family efflux transporter periplasmic adaptor subunit [Nereida sp. MMG025]
MATIDAELNESMRGPSLIIWLVAATLGVFVTWAAFAWIDEIVRADGEIISSSRPQIIQNLEGGILAELMVSQGDEVSPGQVLARLYSTKFQTQVDDLQEQIDALEIRRLRLEAEMAGAFDFAVPDILAERQPEMFASERALLQARQSDYVSRTDGARNVMGQTRKEKDLLEDLYTRNIVSTIEVTRARKTFSDAENKYNEVVTQSELERAGMYSDTLKELANLRQNLKVAQDQLDRTIIVSPMRGVVNNLSITTIGGVIRPGEEIFQIIPMDEELFVEARVRPEDIANIKRGQEATVKLSAYDYTIYGSLKGAVQFISADTFKDERKPDGDPHYKVTLNVDLSNLTERQRYIEIRPGMQAQVELHTGEKTVLQYLLKPLYKSREALREP